MGAKLRETQARAGAAGGWTWRRCRRGLAAQDESQRAREAELKRLEKDADRAGRKQARQYLMDARRLVEEALGAARSGG